jgi:hypothetical protein
LKRELNELELKENQKYQLIKGELEAENLLLNEKLIKLNEEFKAKIEHLQSQQSLETKTLIESLIKENEV